MNKTSVVIVGDGAAGIIFANKLSERTDPRIVEITIIGPMKPHYFKPDGIFIPFNMKDYRSSIKGTRFLLNHRIKRMVGEVTAMDVSNRTVTLDSGTSMNYDYLVIANGDRMVPEEVPGYNGNAEHFYDLKETLHLKESLQNFHGGKIVIGQASIPIQCPPAPYEFTFLLDSYLRQRGIRDKTEIHYTYPINRVFTIENVSGHIQELFDQRGIEYHTLFNTESVDAEKKKLVSLEGEEIDYDLLVLIPPHKGQAVNTKSGLANEFGYIDVDRYKLTYGDYDNVFVIGDATNLPISKAGSAAHYEAEYLSKKIANETSGSPRPDDYDGEVSCFTVTGKDKGMTLHFYYGRAPRASFSSSIDYILKFTSADTYFTTMLRGAI